MTSPHEPAQLDATRNYWGGASDDIVVHQMLATWWGDQLTEIGDPQAMLPYLPTLAQPHPDTPDPTPWLP